MNLFFEHFATLATAPEGIARLRELILQLAVQGKLGTQNVGDEPASKLLQKIRKSREKLAKEGIAKKDKKQEKSDSYNSLTILPDGWEWSRLSEVGLVNPRNFNINDDEEVSFIPMNFIPVGYKNPVQQEVKKWGEIRAGFTHFADNDVVMAKITPCFQNGKSVVLRNLKNGVGAGTTELHVFRSIQNLMDPEYVLLFLKSPEFLNTGITRMTGSAGQKRVPNEYFSETPFPLPPLAEQHRIVAKVDRLMALCDDLEAKQQGERAGCLKLGTASLTALHNAESPEEFERQWAQVCEAFELIFDCPENVAVLRQTILQLAVQGRLGTNNPKDESAEKLFSRIKNEREKRTKGKPIVIRPIENPKLHQLPDLWKWVRLGEVLADIRYGTSEKSDPIFRGIPVIRIPNIGNGILDFDHMKFLQIEDEIDTHKIENGDLLTIRSNGSRDLVGKCAVVKDIDRPIAFASYLIRLRPVLLDSEFLALVLSSQYVRDQFFSSAKTTSGVHNINTEELARTLFALPPLAEQHRIVAKVDALMALCDALESRLKERAAVQERFAKAVGKQVAG